MRLFDSWRKGTQSGTSKDSETDTSQTSAQPALWAKLEGTFGVTKAEARDSWYKGDYQADEAYKKACEKAREDALSYFTRAFALVDSNQVETEYLKRSLLEERERSKSENEKYFISLFGHSIDGWSETTTVGDARALAEEALKTVARYHIGHVHTDIGTVMRLMAALSVVLREGIQKTLPPDVDPESPFYEALRRANVFETVFPLKKRKQVNCGYCSISELAEIAFPCPPDRSSLYSDYNILYWASQSTAPSEDAPTKHLARAFAVKVLHALPDELRSDEGMMRAHQTLSQYPAWFLDLLFGQGSGETLKEFVRDTNNFAMPRERSRLELLEDRIEKLEKLLGVVEDKKDSPYQLAEQLVGLLAKDDILRSGADSCARDFCDRYFELLWDSFSDKGIKRLLALSTDDIDDEMWNYEKWNQLQVLMKVDSLLRLVGR